MNRSYFCQILKNYQLLAKKVSNLLKFYIYLLVEMYINKIPIYAAGDKSILQLIENQTNKQLNTEQWIKS